MALFVWRGIKGGQRQLLRQVDFTQLSSSIHIQKKVWIPILILYSALVVSRAKAQRTLFHVKPET